MTCDFILLSINPQYSRPSNPGHGQSYFCHISFVKNSFAARYIAQVEAERNRRLGNSDISYSRIVDRIYRDGTNKTDFINPDDVSYIVGVLLTIKDSNILQQLLHLVFKGEAMRLADDVYKMINEIHGRACDELTKDCDSNFQTMLAFFSTQNMIGYISNYVHNVVAAYHGGIILDTHIRLLKRATDEFMKRPTQLRQDVVCLLAIKLLRFFQDYFLVVNSVDYSSQFAQQKREADKWLQDFSTCINHVFQVHFPMIFDTCGKEILRILYDVRSFVRMKNQFPSIYETVEASPPTLPYVFRPVSDYISIGMLPYRCFRQLYNAFIKIRSIQKTPKEAQSQLIAETHKYLQEIYKSESYLYDPDLITSDAVRLILNNNNFKTEDPADLFTMLRFLFDALNLANNPQGNVKRPQTTYKPSLLSFFNAIIAELFCTPFPLPQEVNAIRPFYPSLAFITIPKVQIPCFDLIAGRLISNDFRDIKKQSFAELTRVADAYLSVKVIDVIETIRERKSITEKRISALTAIVASREMQSIPEIITNFRSLGVPLSSPQGLEAVEKAAPIVNMRITDVKTTGKVADKVLTDISRILVPLVPPDREGMSSLFDRIDPLATILFCSRLDANAAAFLEWVVTKEAFDVFNNYRKYLAQNMFETYSSVIQRFIREHQRIFWQPIVNKCSCFRQDSKIVETICAFAPVAEVAEMDHSDFAISELIKSGVTTSWRPDARFNFILILKSVLKTIPNFMEHSELIMKYFSVIPSYIREFLRSQILLFGSTRETVAFISNMKRGSHEQASWANEVHISLTETAVLYQVPTDPEISKHNVITVL